MKKIYIECDTIIELAEIKKMLDTVIYDWEKKLILNANLKWRLKDTVHNTPINIEHYKSVLWIDIAIDYSNFTP